MVVSTRLQAEYGISQLPADDVARQAQFSTSRPDRHLRAASLFDPSPDRTIYTHTDALNPACSHRETPDSVLHLVPATYVSTCNPKALPVRYNVQRQRIAYLSGRRDSTHQLYRFRGRDKTEERKYWLNVLARVEPSRRRWSNMLLCGNTVTVKQSACRDGALRVDVHTCDNRFCPACAVRLAHKRIDRSIQVLHHPSAYSLRFITLTVPHSQEPLRVQIARLRKQFRKLRTLPDWQEHVHWGVAVLEVKRNWKNEWHPHLHIVAQGNFYHKWQLRRDWGQATCTCTKRTDPCYASHDGRCSSRAIGTQIDAVKDRKGAVDYVCKYVAKPCMSHALLQDLDAGCELYLAMQRCKTWWLFGTSRPQLPAKEPAVAEHVTWDDWRTVLTWREIIRALINHDEDKIEIAVAAGLPVADIINWLGSSQTRRGP